MTDVATEKRAVIHALIDDIRATRSILPRKSDERHAELCPRGASQARLTLWLAEADLWEHYYDDTKWARQ